MSVLALIRPTSWDLPLLVHVLGAMLLVGTLAAAAGALLLGWRQRAPLLQRLGFWVLLAGSLPSWIVMRVGGEWVASREHYTGNNVPNWIDAGYVVADMGGLLLLVAILVAGFSARRAGARPAGSPTLASVSGILAVLLVLADLFAVWAMSTKPTL